MDDAKRKVLIKSQAAKRKESGEIPKGTAPSIKRKPPSKSDRPLKQQKVSLEPVVGLMAEGVKTVTPVKHGSGKGLMKAPSTSQEKPPPLLRDDSKYALEKLSSIISSEDYEDLANHLKEAMGETGLFAVAQSLVMMKGLMDQCLNREAALERVRAKTEQMEDELGQLNKWKSTMEKKFELSEQVRKELEQKTDEEGKALEVKEKEIQDLKEKLRQAKKVAIY
ncbi:uncharacterized protein LOC126712454 [Quercus robur]|uniref:uncharacterized protein LOC126712454 n=1 Tax=Quercus robur TaxID=38942 RepID=UPI002161DCD8|nr:uncharacterized protein LOC126712454 [Quercus robur]